MSKKEAMISKEDRPSPIDYDAPISEWKVGDLLSVVYAQMERMKVTPNPEYLKPEHWKPELVKPEKELLKPEKELSKPEKEMLKPEKELLKPEKEYSKPEKEFEIEDLVDKVAIRVVEELKKQGLLG